MLVYPGLKSVLTKKKKKSVLTIKQLSNYGISNTFVSCVPGNQIFYVAGRRYKCDIEVKNPLALEFESELSV